MKLMMMMVFYPLALESLMPNFQRNIVLRKHDPIDKKKCYYNWMGEKKLYSINTCALSYFNRFHILTFGSVADPSSGKL